MLKQISPNMLKTFTECPKKFEFRYIKNISMPVNDEIFEQGKNIHALASYYLKGEFIDNLENGLNPKEKELWNYLKGVKYFRFELINTEYYLSFKLGEYYVGGRLDALLKQDDCYYILDYKTGSIPKNPKYDFQTMIYLLAVKEFFKTDKIKFIYLDLKKQEDFIVTFDKELEQEYKTKILSIIEKFTSQEFNYDKNCVKSCEYSKICY